MKQIFQSLVFAIVVFAISIKVMNNTGTGSVINTKVLNDEVLNNTETIKKMNWVYGGYKFTVHVSIDNNSYSYYKSKSKRQSYELYAQDVPTYRYITKVAKTLKKDADQLGYRDKELAAYLTAFVQQNIAYTKDPYNNGFDYPKYPLETLYEKKGDCEDSSILLVSLLKSFGFDAVLLRLPKHMAVGIACDDCKTYYNYNGKKYGYVEATNSNWKIGEMPKEYKKTGATFYETPDLPNVLNEKDEKEFKEPNKTCKCPKCATLKTIRIEGRVYTVKQNETYVIEQNGLVINISNQ